MIVAATGHRPNDIKEEHGTVVLKARVKLQYAKASRLICGMAAGFDLLAGEAAMELGIPITAAIPWTTHKDSISKLWRDKWQEVYDYADVRHVILESDTYPGPQVYFDRNHWMVNNADAVMAYLNPTKTSGGTFECRQYAKSKNVPVANIYFDPPF